MKRCTGGILVPLSRCVLTGVYTRGQKILGLTRPDRPARGFLLAGLFKARPFFTPLVPASNFSACHARRSPAHRRRRALAASAATRPATKPCASSQRPVSRWGASMSANSARLLRCPDAAAYGRRARRRPAVCCRRPTTAATGWVHRCTSGSRTSWRRRSSDARMRTRRWTHASRASSRTPAWLRRCAPSSTWAAPQRTEPARPTRRRSYAEAQHQEAHYVAPVGGSGVSLVAVTCALPPRRGRGCGALPPPARGAPPPTPSPSSNPSPNPKPKPKPRP